jgi:transcriptional regulator with XRE-family HTH domain
MANQAPRTERRILGGAVRRIRELSRMTQAQLATAAGPSAAGKSLNVATISKIESNSVRPSVPVMCGIANALGVDLTDITYLVNVLVVEENVA